MDGTPTCRLNDYICSQLAANKVDHGDPIPRSSLPGPQELKLEVNDEIIEAVEAAGKAFDALVDKHELRVCVFKGYGKDLIKKFRLSPDAYAQMVIQLAYYKMYGKPCATYESAQTRKFRNGRTEVCRTLSSDSLDWNKAMVDPSVSVSPSLLVLTAAKSFVSFVTQAEKKVELLRKAIDSHTRYMADAVEGRGCDRHLLGTDTRVRAFVHGSDLIIADGPMRLLFYQGLRMLLKPEEPKPAIFTDPAYAKSAHWQLSTSQLTSSHFSGYGWGEVVPDGFGVAYMIKGRSLHFNVVSMKLGSERLVQYLSEAAGDMRDVLEKVLGPEIKSKL
ncbi:MAG: carnitine O-acetyltransferase [Olpidium bornovanus]|uniref:Carnitine O-acetyltransferase n=1 Tax=Olpidium bornovanus TaxID=278681 RepID=A0A8H8DGC8_9FUNG|nr:MAG: carnitine O-acetyltransferase [Olpidium bornovanus]